MADTLERIAGEVAGCTRCRLAASRTHAVPGEGPADARLMLVGEAPGRREDESGRPFQGPAGTFLNRALGQLGLTRRDVFVTSVNKCRPPGNRVPRRDEQAACRGYLDRQLALLRPAAVLAMGGTAAAALHPGVPPGRAVRVGRLRGAPIPLGLDRQLFVTYHPAAAMRFPAQRGPFARDLAAAARAAALVV